MKGRPWYFAGVAVFLSLASGVLLAFALPPRDLSFLGWIAFLPLLVASRLTRPLIAAGCGMLTAITCAWILAGHWEVPAELGNLIVAFGGLAVVFAFIAGIASAAAGKAGIVVWPLLVACAGVSGELLGVYVFPVSVAISQHENAAALRIASYTGIWGVSFLIWLVPASVIAFAIKPRTAWPVFGLGAAVVLAGVFVGFPNERGGRTIRVAAIQAPDPYTAADETDRVAPRPEVVVWPEHLMDSGEQRPYEAAKRSGVYVVASFLEPGGEKPRNTARLISCDGKTVASSQKQHLFGRENMDYARGGSSRPARCGGFTAGIAICFDTEFTDITRDLVRKGADIILVPNQDPYMTNSLFHYLHAAVIPFRAAENGVPILWSECTSLSAIYDGYGRRIARAPEHMIGHVRGIVALRERRTFFTLAGDYFAYLCAGALVLAAGAMVRRKFRS